MRITNAYNMFTAFILLNLSTILGLILTNNFIIIAPIVLNILFGIYFTL